MTPELKEVSEPAAEENIKKAKKLAKYTEGLAKTNHWGVDDQDTLEWLISEVERLTKEAKL